LNTVFSCADGEKKGGRRRGAAASPLPCLSSNNSIERLKDFNVLTGGHKRTAYVLSSEIQNLAADFGIERLGFLTLTFRDHVTDIREAQRRFNSLNSNVIKKRYQRAMGVWERQKSGRIHFHLVIVTKVDIRQGFNFDGIANRDYSSASPAIRSEWAFWRETAPKYRFGRTELLPVKSTAEGIARYVGKYVSKHVGERSEKDKGARVVRFIGYKPGDRKFSSKFSWNTDRAWLWRRKVEAFCHQHGYRNTDDLALDFGPRWAYRLQETILGIKLGEGVVWPSLELGMQLADQNQRVEAELDRRNRKATKEYIVFRSPVRGEDSKCLKQNLGGSSAAARPPSKLEQATTRKASGKPFTNITV